VSGAEKTLLDLLRALPDDVEPIVACPNGELQQAVDELGVHRESITGTAGSLRLHPIHTPRGVIETARSTAEVRSAARRLNVDLIHANSIRAGLIGASVRVTGGPPIVSHLHDVLPSGRVGTTIARVLASSSRAVLANSAYTAADFTAKSAGRGHVVVVDNPVDLERFDPAIVEVSLARAQFGLPRNAPLIGVVGQITPWKAQSDAIRALAIARRRHPQLKLVVAGAAKFVDPGTRHDNEAYDRSLRELVRQLDVEEAVIFLGEVNDVPALMAVLDIVLVPSWEEPFGRVVIEAMAMRTPVIATNIGGPADIITDGVDGVSLAPRSPESWSARVGELLDGPEAAAAIGDAARQRVVDRYGLHTFTDAVLSSYESPADAAALRWLQYMSWHPLRRLGATPEDRDMVGAHEPNKLAEIATARDSFESCEPHLFRKPFGAPWGVEPFLKWATIEYALGELGTAPDAEILDLGCGEGWVSLFLAEAGYRPTGIDLAPARVDMAIARAARWSVDATFEIGDMDQLDLGRQFDVVLVYDALHHSARQRTVAERVAQHVRPGGWALFGEPSWLHAVSPGARRTSRELGWIERGIRIRSLRRDCAAAGLGEFRRFFEPTRPYHYRVRGFAWQAARLAAADVAVAPQASVWLAARRP
jgi:glycosyltransferase involved in cell wall biosynthesis/2-polyprenyl-3-methyl-5-hydroxy-6-metoxy-1,4-benzoquinol methylase